MKTTPQDIQAALDSLNRAKQWPVSGASGQIVGMERYNVRIDNVPSDFIYILQHALQSHAPEESTGDGIIKEKQKDKFDSWFLYDGDDSGLAEFLAAVDYDWFTKAGRDKKQMFVVFLKSGETSTAAIRCQSQKNYQKLLAILREESTQQPEHEGE